MVPLVSVIIAVYNNETYLPFAVESVLDSGSEDFEIIIVDDGSTDSTPQIADKFAEKDSRIKVIHQHNQWVYASFNNGIAAATGKYIFILNSDDRMADGTLLKIKEISEKYDPDIIIAPVQIERMKNGQPTPDYILGIAEKDSFYADKEAVEDNWVNWFINTLIANQANAYRADIAKKHMFRNDNSMADTYYNIQIADDIRSAFVCKDPFYNFIIYHDPNMNISVEKYNVGAHAMYDDFYFGLMELLTKWNKHSDRLDSALLSHRLRYLSTELRDLLFDYCPLNVSEKVSKVMSEASDCRYYRDLKTPELVEEWESRILSGLKNIFLVDTLPADDEYYFIYEMLEHMLKYEYTDQDIEIINLAVHNPKNPNRIGGSFYKKIQDYRGV